ncbi:MAG: hypothetical protein N3A54_00955 [Patescibacteria group bacterium]|nr:hypothetical protein [Patescibacteria group bacterium]
MKEKALLIIEEAVYRAVKKFLLDEKVIEKLMESVIRNTLEYLKENKKEIFGDFVERSVVIKNNGEKSVQKPVERDKISSNGKKVIKVTSPASSTHASLGKWNTVIDEGTMRVAREMENRKDITGLQSNNMESENYYDFCLGEDGHDMQENEKDKGEASSFPGSYEGSSEYEAYRNSLMKESVSMDEIFSLLKKK